MLDAFCEMMGLQGAHEDEHPSSGLIGGGAIQDRLIQLLGRRCWKYVSYEVDCTLAAACLVSVAVGRC